jgi:hypothetical protein
VPAFAVKVADACSLCRDVGSADTGKQRKVGHLWSWWGFMMSGGMKWAVLLAQLVLALSMFLFAHRNDFGHGGSPSYSE